MQTVLSGVKVVEQGTFITGPCAGMMLADLGADVIKIESPGGDPYRAYQGGLYSPHFQAYNRNKRNIVCDLRQPGDYARYERLVDEDRPRFLGPALADAITGIYAAFGVLGALLERAGSGRGKLVEVSMLEAMAHFAVEPFAAFFALGAVPKSSDRPRLAQAYILRTADGGLIAIHLSSLEKFWTGLTTALASDRLNNDERFRTRQGRIDHYE